MRCTRHAKARTRAYDKARSSAAARGYGWRWANAAKAFLRMNRLCRYCAARGETRLATEVDHITPHNGDPRLFWDLDNWQLLCKPCHSSKTAREDGRWG